MDHSYSTKRARLQKVDHCYFSIGKKTPKVILRKAEVLKNSQKNNKIPIGEDHSYHKINHLVDKYQPQSIPIEDNLECQENVSAQDLTIEKEMSQLRNQTIPNFALKVFKSQSDKEDKVIFYVNCFSQNGKRLRIKRTIKKYLKKNKIKPASNLAKKEIKCDDKHSDHNYFSKKYRTKSLPVLFKNHSDESLVMCEASETLPNRSSPIHFPSTTSTFLPSSLSLLSISQPPPLSPPVPSSLSPSQMSSPSHKFSSSPLYSSFETSEVITDKVIDKNMYTEQENNYNTEIPNINQFKNINTNKKNNNNVNDNNTNNITSNINYSIDINGISRCSVNENCKILSQSLHDHSYLKHH